MIIWIRRKGERMSEQKKGTDFHLIIIKFRFVRPFFFTLNLVIQSFQLACSCRTRCTTTTTHHFIIISFSISSYLNNGPRDFPTINIFNLSPFFYVCVCHFCVRAYLLFLLIHNERLKWISLELFRPSSLLESCFLCMFEFRWILVMNFKREGRACTKNELNRRTYYSYRCLSSFSDEMERKRPFYVFDVTQWNGF